MKRQNKFVCFIDHTILVVVAELVDFFLDVFKGCADDDDVEEDEDVDNEDLSLLSRADDNNGEDGCEEVDVVYA